VAALLAAAKATAISSRSSTDATAAATAVLLPSLRCCRLLMQLPDCRAAFLSSGGPELLLQLLQGCNEALPAQQQQQQPEQLVQQYQLAAAAASLVEAASWQDEEGKCMYVCVGVCSGDTEVAW
jgi:hypothetical protein